MKIINRVLKFALVILLFWLVESCKTNSVNNYKGTPFSDEEYGVGAQVVPGKIQCEYFDVGGEASAFHDSDTINSGSGGLNKVDGSYLNEFRINEAVDISYTKFRNPPIDNTTYNFVETTKNQLYVGWTEPGEWIKYTVDVIAEGDYKLGLMYTSNKNGKISFSINNVKETNSILIPSTYVAEDTVSFRQWHHWNYLEDMVTIHLRKGIQVITLHTDEIGAMNYDYIDFIQVK
ncbi:MAG: carbohydrate-binding protein [Prolixibacteraceae bacterium]|jgi:hypothetical protein|nr:carbohydrate-binding protein [Prolixibacteraceae bacterium]